MLHDCILLSSLIWYLKPRNPAFRHIQYILTNASPLPDEKVICKLEGIALSLTATQAAAAAAAPPPPPTQSLVDTLNKVLKIRGASLDLFDKERMDKVFVSTCAPFLVSSPQHRCVCPQTSLKQACRVDTLNAASKLKLVEVMEIRAMGWKTNENVENYYRHKLAQLEVRWSSSLRQIKLYLDCFLASYRAAALV